MDNETQTQVPAARRPAYFRDKEIAQHLRGTVSYATVGLILETFDKGHPCGKDFSVIYVDPFDATTERAWRGVDEIEIFYVEPGSFEEYEWEEFRNRLVWKQD